MSRDWAGGIVNPWRSLVEGVNAPIAQTMARLGYGDAQTFGPLIGWVPRHKKARHLAILRHPLWNDAHPSWQSALAAAALEFPERTVMAVNPFVALRRPGECC